ncbi:murein L,D-transpeptidase catalytic domain family protein [Croceicoccus sp. Ery15]|uniref:murein L,D-transpeptidase catalytic domain family protein n=1 Tax=Croceicoccus sp. Ery15 TaxID=1703338 RepID=UPI001E49A9EB|nr:murein L,D-transpeptidase catalytic domain family protein [Croceicoccus sp. Ery15]
MNFSRRNFIASASTLLATSATVARAAPAPLVSQPVVQPVGPEPVALDLVRGSGVRPDLFMSAMEALDRHGARVRRDRIGIVDFSAHSSLPRFHLVDLDKGETQSLLVSHGSGSDPAYSGWLQRFSNRPGSNATSEGAYATANYYTGKHGHSQRLIGLDPTNDNAMNRAIVIHSAWYAEPEIVERSGKLGRSQGCFAFSRRGLDQVFAHLGEGRLIYARKMGGLVSG